MAWDREKGGGGEKERLGFWRNVRENKQKGKQWSKNKEAKLVRMKCRF